MTDLKIGSVIEFTAIRIAKGNPVRGILRAKDKSGIEVELLKDIEGLVTIWYKGEKRHFDFFLIHSIKEVTKI
jgi:hypothetical protein